MVRRVSGWTKLEAWPASMTAANIVGASAMQEMSRRKRGRRWNGTPAARAGVLTPPSSSSVLRHAVRGALRAGVREPTGVREPVARVRAPPAARGAPRRPAASAPRSGAVHEAPGLQPLRGHRTCAGVG
eukprot:scaffold52284_cov51-Phaeocystis_antarctica.AAC.2